MAFCTNCGAEIEGRFCANCGFPAPVSSSGSSSAEPPPPPLPGSPPYSSAGPRSTVKAAGLEENLASALCYFLGIITGVLFLVLAPYNQNRLIRFHAFQSIFLTVAWIAVHICISIISLILLPIPFLGVMFSIVLHMAAGLGIFILWLMLMYKAYNRERWVLPVIGPLAEKQA
jgi:uncharacterized membrane protein